MAPSVDADDVLSDQSTASAAQRTPARKPSSAEPGLLTTLVPCEVSSNRLVRSHDVEQRSGDVVLGEELVQSAVSLRRQRGQVSRSTHRHGTVVDGQAVRPRLVAGRKVGRDVGTLRDGALRASPPAIVTGLSRIAALHDRGTNRERIAVSAIGRDRLEQVLRDSVALDDLRASVRRSSLRCARWQSSRPPEGSPWP